MSADLPQNLKNLLINTGLAILKQGHGTGHNSHTADTGSLNHGKRGLYVDQQVEIFVM